MWNTLNGSRSKSTAGEEQGTQPIPFLHLTQVIKTLNHHSFF